MKINLNDYIKVRLTPYGIDILTEYYSNSFKNFYTDEEILAYMNTKFEDGFLKIQMWEFCNVFGDYMLNGNEQLIFKNEIRINE